MKRDSAAIKTIAVPSDGILDADTQFINAYDTDDGKVVMDVIRTDTGNTATEPTSWPWAASIEDFTKHTGRRSLLRYTIDPSKGSIVSKETLVAKQCYFGVINPAVSASKHRYVYFAVGAMGSAVAPPQGIARLDTESNQIQEWIPNASEFCGEPMFVAKEGAAAGVEDDGYVLSVLYNGKARESELVVFDAANVSSGPIARVSLGVSVPHGLYGCFAPNEVPTVDEVDRRAKLADKMESRGNMWNEVKSDFSGLGLRLDDLEEYFGDIM